MCAMSSQRLKITAFTYCVLPCHAWSRCCSPNTLGGKTVLIGYMWLKMESGKLCHSRGACLHPNFCLDYVISSQQLLSSAGLLHTAQMFLLLLLHDDFSSSSIDRYFQMCPPISLDRPFLLTKSRSHCCSGF